MRQTVVRGLLLCLLLALYPGRLAGQSTEGDLAEVSRRLKSHIQQTRKDWKHELIPPFPAPLGPPSTAVVIHKWTSERCGTVELLLDGRRYGEQPVACGLSLVIDQSSSATVAADRLSRFIHDQRGISRGTPTPLGDKGYIQRDQTVFLKGRFVFYVRGSVDLRVGEFSMHQTFTEKMAEEIAKVVSEI